MAAAQPTALDCAAFGVLANILLVPVETGLKRAARRFANLGQFCQAMEQALDARGCALPLRGGVAAGRVILFEGDDYIGRPVNLAARLCDEAEPHQLLVTASLFDMSGEGLAHRRLGPHAIRGFTRPVEVVDMSEGGDHALAT